MMPPRSLCSAAGPVEAVAVAVPFCEQSYCTRRRRWGKGGGARGWSCHTIYSGTTKLSAAKWNTPQAQEGQGQPKANPKNDIRGRHASASSVRAPAPALFRGEPGPLLRRVGLSSRGKKWVGSYRQQKRTFTGTLSASWSRHGQDTRPQKHY